MSSVVGVRGLVVLLLACGLVTQACGDDGSSGGGSPADGGESATGGKASQGVEGGQGGEVSTPPVSVPPVARSGTAIVSAGTIATSENFRVLLTLGEMPGGNTSMKSAQHRVNLGVVGSTQSN